MQHPWFRAVDSGIRPRQQRLRAGRLLMVLAILTAAAPLSMDIYTPSLPHIQADLGGADSLAQASITACLFGIGIGQLLWGPLSDRVGRRPVVLVGVIGWSFTSLLSALSTTSTALIAARFLAGLCGAAGIVVARSIVRDMSADAETVAARIGLLSMVAAIAPVMAPAIGAAIAFAWGWRMDFLALAGFGAVATLASAMAAPETLPRTSRSSGRGFAIAWALADAARHRELAAVAITLAAHSFGFYAYIATASFIVERQFGYPPAVFALVFATNAVAMLGANIVFRHLVRRCHPVLPLGIGLSVCALSGLALFLAASRQGPEWVLWTTSMTFTAGAGLVLSSAHSWGQATIVASGAASALTGSAQFLGGVLGSPFTGLVGPTAEHLGLVIAASSAVGLLAWSVARRLHSHKGR